MRIRLKSVGVRCALVILLVGLLSGCLGTVRMPAFPPPVRLVSPESFTLYATDASTSQLVPHCMVRQVDASVLGMSGDTLLLTDVRVLKPAPEQPACTPADSLRLLIASDTLVQAQTMEVDGDKSIWTTVLLLPVFLLGLAAVLFIIGGGPST